MLSRLLCLASSLTLVVACGDNGDSSAADAPSTPTIDALPATIDAVACDLTGYPERVRPESVELLGPTTLTLDGTGTRCEQLIRALTDPTGRPPELADLDAAGVTGSCFLDDVTGRDIVRMQFPSYAGAPVFAPIQDVLAHVDPANIVQFLAGTFLPAGRAPAAGCIDGAAAVAAVPGATLGYQRFAFCSPMGEGMYTIAADDQIELGEEGFLLDGDENLRRVFSIDVYLLPAHVTTEITNSDAYCCTGETGVEHCVGQRIFIDAFTGDVVGQQPHCHTC